MPTKFWVKPENYMSACKIAYQSIQTGPLFLQERDFAGTESAPSENLKVTTKQTELF